MSDERYTVDDARAAAEAGELREWVVRFLASPGSDNAPLAQKLCERIDSWDGPLQLPLTRLHRLAGPPEDPVLCSVDDDYWDDRVDDMAERIEDDDWEPSPVIVAYRDGRLVLEDGNHRVESLRRAGRDQAWAIVGFASESERAEFATLTPRPG